jgi:transposase
MPRKNSLSPEKRTEVVLALLRKEDTIANLARRYGVSEQSLYRWREEFVSGGKQQLAGKGASADSRREVEQLKREVAERDQVIGEITIANRVLKKLSDPLQ